MRPISTCNRSCEHRISVIQAPEPEPRIMRCDSRTLSGVPSDRSFRTSRAGCRGSTTDVSSTASFGYCGQAHLGAICRRLWALRDLLQPICSLANGWNWDLIMDALTETYDGSIQMIDTSIVRVHQHGGCAGGGETRLMAGREVDKRPKYTLASIPTDCAFASN